MKGRNGCVSLVFADDMWYGARPEWGWAPCCQWNTTNNCVQLIAVIAVTADRTVSGEDGSFVAVSPVAGAARTTAIVVALAGSALAACPTPTGAAGAADGRGTGSAPNVVYEGRAVAASVGTATATGCARASAIGRTYRRAAIQGRPLAPKPSGASVAPTAGARAAHRAGASATPTTVRGPGDAGRVAGRPVKAAP